MEYLEQFFERYKFKEIRNDVFKGFYDKINKYGEQDTSLVDKYNLYLSKNDNKLISIKNFTFKKFAKNIVLCPPEEDLILYFDEIKIINIFDEKNVAHEEYIYSVYYLKYIIYNIYEMKNPKFSNDEDSLNSESSAISITDDNISRFVSFKSIYESKHLNINYEDIIKCKRIKNFKAEEKKQDKYFFKLIGLDKFENKENILTDNIIKLAAIDELIVGFKNLETETLIFHNENDFLPLNVISNFDILYEMNKYRYAYIDFNILKNVNHKERLEYFFYCLITLFSLEHSSFIDFFENQIENLLTKNYECLSVVIPLIIKYIKNNFLKKENGNNEKGSIEFKKDVYYIIFNDVDNQDYYNIIKNIIDECDLKNNFKFLVIFPLNNNFACENFFDCISNNHQIFFANYKNFNEDEQYIEEKLVENVYSEEKKEKFLYDMLRIYNFEKIYNNNNYPVLFLKDYIEYINIKFDNTKQKISKIAFKNKSIQKYFDDIYEKLLRYIKIKQEHKYKNIKKQQDHFDLEKLIISTIISDKKNFKELKVNSIFGLQEIKKQANVNYKYINYIIQQECLTAEVFDFGLKITIQDKTYLKLYQVTSSKSEEDLERLCLERIKVYISYIVKKLKKEELGEIDGVSFGIITFTEIHGGTDYFKLKNFCKTHNYEFILFDLDKSSFKIRENHIYKDYDTELFNFNDAYNLNISKFEEIIRVKENIPIEMLSTRHVKGRDEKKEDESAQLKYNQYTGNKEIKIKRVSKLEYYGEFNDIKNLDEDYFIYYYSKDKEYYFYKNEIKGSDDVDKSYHKITIILFSKLNQLIEYEDSSVELKTEKKIKIAKIKKDKKKKNLQKEEKTDENNIAIGYEENDPNIEDEHKKKKPSDKGKSKFGKTIISNLGKKRKNEGDNK